MPIASLFHAKSRIDEFVNHKNSEKEKVNDVTPQLPTMTNQVSSLFLAFIGKSGEPKKKQRADTRMLSPMPQS